MTILKYKGYQASIEFEDGALLIEVLHVRGLLTTECDRASDAQKAFEGLIDVYLADCERLSVEPEKPFKGSFNVRIDPEMHRKAAMAAAGSKRSLNSWVADSIRDAIENK